MWGGGVKGSPLPDWQMLLINMLLGSTIRTALVAFSTATKDALLYLFKQVHLILARVLTWVRTPHIILKALYIEQFTELSSLTTRHQCCHLGQP
jgi:hypothetical protein